MIVTAELCLIDEILGPLACIFRVRQDRKSSRTISLGATWARGSLGCQGDTVNAMKIGENRTPNLTRALLVP
jgi:hypothetical protein